MLRIYDLGNILDALLKGTIEPNKGLAVLTLKCLQLLEFDSLPIQLNLFFNFLVKCFY
jgi:hypothetical protein